MFWFCLNRYGKFSVFDFVNLFLNVVFDLIGIMEVWDGNYGYWFWLEINWWI